MTKVIQYDCFLAYNNIKKKEICYSDFEVS